MKAIKLKKDGTPRKNNAGKNQLPENMVMMGLGSISLDRLLVQSKELAKEVRFAGRQAARDKAKELLKKSIVI